MFLISPELLTNENLECVFVDKDNCSATPPQAGGECASPTCNSNNNDDNNDNNDINENNSDNSNTSNNNSSNSRSNNK